MNMTELITLCRKYLSRSYFNYNKVRKQIDDYTKNLHLTYDQLAKIIEYWYGIKQSDPSKSGGGIGIIPYIYEEALAYWNKKENIQEIAKEVEQYSKPQTEQITAPRPRIVKPKTLKLFDLK